jgi:5-methylcytosine-specific restriction endonuclease McrA
MRPKVQTGSEKGFFSKGDAHPCVPDRFFNGYTSAGKENWVSGGARANILVRQRDYNKDYYQDNRECFLGYAAIYREENAEAAQEACKKWREENRDKSRAASARWAERNLEKRRVAQSLRKARIRSGSNTQCPQIRFLYEQCARLNSIFNGTVFQVDHTVPLSLGGKHEARNLQIVPVKWNLSKGNRNSNKWEVPYGLA